MQLVKAAIGVAVCLSASSLLFQSRLRSSMDAGAKDTDADELSAPGTWNHVLTVATGAMLGLLVTLTSVGAGALGAVCLYHLYPRRLTPLRLVATDIAHAIPLALCAGAGHLAISQVDSGLLRDLLAGFDPRGHRGRDALEPRAPYVAAPRRLARSCSSSVCVMLGSATR